MPERIRAIVLLVLMLAAVAFIATRRPATPAQPPPNPTLASATDYTPRAKGSLTFGGEIAPLIWKHCAECHRPDGAAPFSLLTFADVQKRAKQIGEVTARRYMPPWLPELGHLEFIGQRGLTADELGMLQQWIAEGAIEGLPISSPAAPEQRGGWRLGKPDLVLRMPEPYLLSAEGPDIYRNFVVPTGLTNGHFVRAVEFQPGGRGVHHARILFDDTGACRDLDTKDPGPGFGGWMPPAHFPVGHFVTWVPGKAPVIAGDGLSWRIEAGEDVVLQLHMQRTGREEPIQPRIGFYFTNAPPTRGAFVIGLLSRMIDIPAGTAAYSVRREFELPVPVELNRIMPHAHYLARRVDAHALLPDGTRRTLLRINDWDFNWQDEYRLAQPLLLPAGTRLRTEMIFDNSAANPHNPNHPPVRVRHGPQSTDEMSEVWMQVVVNDPVAFNRLEAAHRRRSTEESAAYFDRRLQENALDLTARIEFGKALGALGRTVDAKMHFNLALQSQTNNAEALYFLGIALYSERNFPEAKKQFELAVKSEPKHARAEHGLALVALAARDFAAAEKHATNAIAINPRDPNFHLTLNRVFRERTNAPPVAPK
jgi:Flp pilus assembly protein TadD